MRTLTLAPMDISEVRRHNLRVLINEEFAGSLAEFSRFIGKDPSYVSRYFSSKNQMRNIGSTTARQIEQRLQRPRGWLDRPHGGVGEDDPAPYAPLPPEARQIAEAWQALPKVYREVVRELLNTLRETTRKR